jgi:hypothetical protein
VLGEFPGDAWQICWTPGKHPPVLTEELDEHAFLLWGEQIRHPHCIGWIYRVDLMFVRILAGIE